MIYFVQSSRGSGHIKIGTTIRLTERLKQIAADLNCKAEELIVVAVMDGGFDEERNLHARFASHRIYGEWFSPNPELTDFMAMEGKPWDGKDEIPKVTVKIDADVVRMAKLVALERKTTIAEYLTELLRGQVSRDFAKSVRRLTTEEDKS